MVSLEMNHSSSVNIDSPHRYLSRLNSQSQLVLHIIIYHLPISMTISYYDYVLLVGKYYAVSKKDISS